MFGAFGAGMAFQFINNIDESKEASKLILNELEMISIIEFDYQKKN